MDKTSQIRLIFGIFLISILLIGIFFFSFVSAYSFNPEDNRTMGYEFLNEIGEIVSPSEATIVHIWNTQDDYFFEKDAGIQLTNHFQDYWTKNIFCIGFYNASGWNKIRCADELNNFNKSIETDNETYVNATLWKDIAYEGYDLRLGVQYHLGLNDKTLSITIYGKNIGIDIPFDIGFAWKITDWEIPYKGTINGDSIRINNTNYELNGTFDLLFKNMTKVQNITTYDNETNTSSSEIVYNLIPFLRGYDYGSYLTINWNENLNYAVKMVGNGNQEDFYVALLINAGTFNSGQEKSTTLYWIDAEGDYTGFHWDTSAAGDPQQITTDGTNFWVVDYSATERIYKYNITGGYVNDWELVESDTPYGIATDGNYYWVVEHTGAEVYKYQLDGTYTNEHFDIGTQGCNNPTGLATDGNYIWVLDMVDDLVYKYQLDGTYVSSFDTSAAGDNGYGIGTDGNYIWISDRTSDKVYKYYMNMTYAEFNFSVAGEMAEPRGCGVYGGYIWVNDATADEVYKYEGAMVDSTPPNVTINTPINITYPINTILFNVTALDDIAMDSCWISIDSGVTNLTLLNTTHNDQYNATNTTVPDGSYHTQVWCNDTSNNINNTENVTFIINTPPTIPTQLEPENATGYAMNSTITFTWSNSTDASGDTITYDLEIYNESYMAVENLIHSNISIAEGAVNTSISIKLSDYTTTDDDYYWRIRANDSVRASDWSETWEFQYANWSITFNLTDSVTGEQIDTTGPQYHFDISCDNGFNILDVNNPYTATDIFAPGTWECNFYEIEDVFKRYNGKSQSFSADGNKIVQVSVSEKAYLTTEEHDWLEWLYTCWNGGDCWDLLNNINTTTTQTWQRLTGTDTNVITQEDVISSVLNSTSNITINYIIDIPYKAGVAINELLPIRLYFWFTDVNRTTCYNQDKATDTNRAENPYCLPLVAEILGPNNGSKTFTVDLRPNLSDDTYNFTRSIEIDPLGIWTQYGREDIGQIEVQEGGDSSIGVSHENNQNQPIDYSGSDSSSTNSKSSGSSLSKTTIIREREIITLIP